METNCQFAANPNQISNKTPHGIHPSFGMEQYHAWKLDRANLKAGPVSCSMLKDFVINPYAWLRQEEKPPTAAMQTGSIMDAAVTEPHRLESVARAITAPPSDLVVAPFDEFRTKKARAWKEVAEKRKINYVSQSAYSKMLDEIEDRLQETLKNARACAEAVRSHHVAGAILDGAGFQVAAVADIGGIPAKCLIDILPGRGEYEETLFDYKTTSSGLDDESIRKTISNFRYHWQAGFYRTVFNKASKDRLCERFGFIFQDPQTREVRVVILDDDSMAMGTRCIAEAVKEFTRCAHQGIHSRYAKTESTLGIMPYTAMNEDEWLIKQQEQ